MFIKYFKKIHTLFVVMVFTQTVCAGEFAVSPMMIEIDLVPGESRDFEFKVHGKKEGKAKIFFSDMKQQASGHMDFLEARETGQSLSDWVELSDKEVSLKKDETKIIKGKIKLPRNISGNHYMAIMIEDQEANTNKGVSLNVRYAIVLNVRTPIRSRRTNAEFSNFNLEKQGGEYFISGWIENKSNKDEFLESVTFIRDESRRLVTKVPLKSKSAWQREEDFSRIFPEGKVKVYGRLPGEVVSGRYTIITKNKFGGRVFPSIRKDVVVVKQQSIKVNSTSTITISPNPISLKVQHSGLSFVTLKLTNPIEDEINIKLPVEGEYDGVKVRFTPQELTLKPKSSRLVTLKQVFREKPIKQTFRATLIQDHKPIKYIEINTKI